MRVAFLTALRLGLKDFLKISATVLVALPQTTSFFVGCSPIRYGCYTNINCNSNRRSPCSPYSSSASSISSTGSTSSRRVSHPRGSDDELHGNRRGFSACVSLRRSLERRGGGARRRAAGVTVTAAAINATPGVEEKTKKRSTRLPSNHLLLPAFQELESALTRYLV